MEVDFVLGAPAGELSAEEAVGGGSSGDGEVGEGVAAVELGEAVEDLGDGGGAEGGQEVEDQLGRLLLAEVDRAPHPLEALDLQQGLALEPRIGESEVGAAAGDRQAEGGRIAALGQLVDLGPLRVGDAEALADLV